MLLLLLPVLLLLLPVPMPQPWLLLLLPPYEWRWLWRAINQGTPCNEIRAFHAAHDRDDRETSKMTVT